jgi:hypothetical protein
MKEFAKALVNDFNHERIYHGKNVWGCYDWFRW